MLAEEGIGAAIFSTLWGYKKEAYDASVRTAEILTNAGVQVAFKVLATTFSYLASRTILFSILSTLFSKAKKAITLALMPRWRYKPSR